MTDNEKIFAESIVNFEANLKRAQRYIKENYNIDSEFDSENSELHLVSNVAENAMMLAAAKEYISENFDDSIICVMGMMSEAKNSSDVEIVYVVRDTNDKNIIGVFNDKKDAEKCKSEYSITKDMVAEIEEAPKSDYEN